MHNSFRSSLSQPPTEPPPTCHAQAGCTQMEHACCCCCLVLPPPPLPLPPPLHLVTHRPSVLSSHSSHHTPPASATAAAAAAAPFDFSRVPVLPPPPLLLLSREGEGDDDEDRGDDGGSGTPTCRQAGVALEPSLATCAATAAQKSSSLEGSCCCWSCSRPWAVSAAFFEREGIEHGARGVGRIRRTQLLCF